MTFIGSFGRAIRQGLTPAIAALGLAGPVVALSADFDDFYRGFQAAAARNDSDAIAELTRLPFLFEGVPLDRTEFVAALPQLFTQAVRDCVARTEPILEDLRYVVFCRPYAFYFGRQKGLWRLDEFAADGEDLP